LGALARGGAAPHHPGGNLKQLSRPQAVRTRPAGPCCAGCRAGLGVPGWLPVPAQGVLRLSTPALGLLADGRVLALAEGDLGLASGAVELLGSPAAGAVLQLQRAGDVGVQREHLVQAGGVQQPGDVAVCGGQAKLAVASP